VAQELSEAAAYTTGRQIGVSRDILSLLRQGRVDTAVRALIAKGRPDLAAKITEAATRARVIALTY